MIAILDEDNNAIGSGFIIRSDGFIVTCHHIIFQLNEIKVRYNDQIYIAEWCDSCSDSDIDISILKIDIENAIPVVLTNEIIDENGLIFYGYPRSKIEYMPYGCDLDCKEIQCSSRINTFETYEDLEIKYTNKWNVLPNINSSYDSYKSLVKVEEGFSGGAVVRKSTGDVIGVIQSSKDDETRIIRWKNISEKLKQINVNVLDPVCGYFDYFDLPEGFVKRDDKYKEVKEAILNCFNNKESSSVVLAGFGGYGKTVLANWICRDQVIRNTFIDGIIKVEMGKEKKDHDSIKMIVVNQIKKIAGTSFSWSGINNETQEFIRVIGDKKILIFIDDVWYANQIFPFVQGGKNCVRLITTRNDSILPKTKPIKVSGLIDKQAFDLLTKDILISKEAKSDFLIKSLCVKLGNWAQMLSISNRWLWDRFENNGRDISLAIKSFEILLNEKGLVAFDPEDVNDGKRNLTIRACIEASLDDLKKDDYDRFFELSVFPDGEYLPIDIIALLWKKTSGMSFASCEELCNKLNHKSLFDSFSFKESQVKLHDNIIWYLRYRESTSIDNIENLHNHIISELKDRYKNNKSDFYTWQRMIWHLKRVNRLDEINLLLTDYSWIKGKLFANGVYKLLAEYDSELINPHSKKVGNAIALSINAVLENPLELSYQLWGRLAYFHENEIDELLVQAKIDLENEKIVTFFPSLTPPGLERIRLIGHNGLVNSVKLFNVGDSYQIVTASKDQTARIWSAESGQLMSVLEGHDGDVTSAVYSFDGYQIATASEDCTARIWNTITGEVTLLEGHYGAVNTAVFSCDDKMILTSSDDNTARIWNIKTGEVHKELIGHKSSVNSAVYSSDCKKILTASKDKTAKIWDAEKGIVQIELTGHKDIVNTATFSPDNTKIVTASDDHTAIIWDVDTGKIINRLIGHKDIVNSALFSHDGKMVVTASNDKTALIWNADSGESTGVRVEHEFSVKTAIFSVNDTYVVTSSSDKTSYILNILFESNYSILKGHEGVLTNAEISDNEKLVVTSSHDNTARVWNVGEYHEPDRLRQFHKSKVNCISISRDGNLMATSSIDKTVKIWNLKSGELCKTLIGHKASVNKAIFSPDASILISVSDDYTSIIWDMKSYQLLKELIGHESGVNSVVVSDNSMLIITISDDGVIIVWEKKSWKILYKINGYSHLINNVFLLQDDSVVMTVSNNGVTNSWGLFTGEPVIRYDNNDLWITNSVVSFDGKNIALILVQDDDEDGEKNMISFLKITKNIEKKSIYEVEYINAYIKYPAFSPDSKKFSVIVFDANRGDTYCEFDDIWFIKVINTVDGKDVIVSEEYIGYVKKVVYSIDSSLIMVLFNSENIVSSLLLYDTCTGEKIDFSLDSSDTIIDVMFLDCDSSVIVIAYDKFVVIKDIYNKRSRMKFHFDACVSVLSAQNDLIAIGDNIGRFHLLKIKEK